MTPSAAPATAICATVLFGAIGLILYGETRPLKRTFFGSLQDVLPDKTAGWTRELRPVAETPEMQKAVAEQLNFDDAVFAVYSRGSLRISIYAAYWTPGKMQHRMVARHTPDICWVNAGWKRQRSELLPGLDAFGQMLPAAEYREMQFASVTEFLLFWHIVGGATHTYGTQGRPPWYAALLDIWRNGINQRAEQFFVRVSANAPLEQWWSTPLVQHVASHTVAARVGR